jgi:hypothetical protein
MVGLVRCVGLVCGMKCGKCDRSRVFSMRVHVGPQTGTHMHYRSRQCAVADLLRRASDTSKVSTMSSR